MISLPMPSPGSTAIFMWALPEQPGKLRLPARFEGADLVGMAQGHADLVQPVEQRMAARRIHVELVRLGAIGGRHRLPLEVHDEAESGQRTVVEQAIHFGFGEHHRQETVLEAVVEENVAVGRRDDALETILLQGPGRMLARAAATEVLAREQDLGALVARLVEHEIRIQRAFRVVHPGLADVQVAPRVEQVLAVAGALDGFQELLRDDRVGIDVGAVERRHQSVQHGEFVHQRQLRTSTKCPAIAAAAAIAGLTRCVRPPAPCRPSKLRFEVEAQRSPGSSRSAFIARHIEQPGSRHSKPAARKTRSSPSSSACSFTSPEPGTTIACTWPATRCPLAIEAAARRSSIRALVHEPMKTRSILSSVSGVPGASPMYRSERSIAARWSGSAIDAGSGTRPVIGSTSCGLVPQVTSGTIFSDSVTT